MKLFFFGGSFDPPHRGHLEIIQSCCTQCDLLLLIPAAHSPLKESKPIADAKHRFQMLKLLIHALESNVKIDDWEIKQSGPSYSIQTIRYLQWHYPNSDISIVIGADQLEQIQQWKSVTEILDSVNFIGLNRRGCNFTPPPKMNLTWVPEFQVDISSTEIRKKISMGQFPEKDIPTGICAYIRKYKLYGCQ